MPGSAVENCRSYPFWEITGTTRVKSENPWTGRLESFPA